METRNREDVERYDWRNCVFRVSNKTNDRKNIYAIRKRRNCEWRTRRFDKSQNQRKGSQNLTTKQQQQTTKETKMRRQMNSVSNERSSRYKLLMNEWQQQLTAESASFLSVETSSFLPKQQHICASNTQSTIETALPIVQNHPSQSIKSHTESREIKPTALFFHSTCPFTNTSSWDA